VSDWGIEMYVDEKFTCCRIASRCVERSIPNIRMDPAVGVTSPRSIWIVVVLPAPFGPNNPRISPGLISNDTSSTAVKSPNRLVRCATCNTGVVMAGNARLS